MLQSERPCLSKLQILGCEMVRDRDGDRPSAADMSLADVEEILCKDGRAYGVRVYAAKSRPCPNISTLGWMRDCEER
jgi:hypothetical protein